MCAFGRFVFASMLSSACLITGTSAFAQLPNANSGITGENLSVVAKSAPVAVSQRPLTETTTTVSKRNRGRSPDEDVNAATPERKQASGYYAIDVPLKSGGFYLGDVGIRVSMAGDVKVATAPLCKLLKKIAKPDVIASAGREDTDGGRDAGGEPQGVIEAVKGKTGEAVRIGMTPAAPAGPRDRSAAETYVPLTELQRRHLDLHYDSSAAELILVLDADQRLPGTISLTSETAQAASAHAIAPASFSAYLNVQAGVDYVSQSAYRDTGIRTPAFEFEGAARMGEIVVEGEALFAPRGSDVPFASGVEPYDFTRRGTRLVYDRPEDVLRFKAGDLAPGFTGFQASPNVLGISAQRTYSELRPGQNIRPTAENTFRIDRPANVDILVDGVIARRLRLQPGSYNVRDLPLRPGATRVTLSIEDDAGVRQTIDFTSFSSQDGLAPGIDEWHIAAGAVASPGEAEKRGNPGAPVHYNEPHYRWDTPVATGFYRYGVSAAATAGLNGQISSDTAMGGASLSAQTPYGYVLVDLAGSVRTRGDTGFGGRITYEALSREGAAVVPESFRLTAEYRSDAFAVVDPSVSIRDYGTALSAIYSRSLSRDLTASVSGTAYLFRDELFAVNRWEADVTFSQRLSDSVSSALSAGYRDGGSVQSNRSCVCLDGTDLSGFSLLGRLSYRPDASSSSYLSADAALGTVRAGYAQSGGNGQDRWNAGVEAGQDTHDRTSGVDASVNLSGNRGEVSVSHASRLDGVSGGSFDPRITEERSSFRFATAIATADGAWSFGRPIRNSFAIVQPHESLSGHDIRLGPKDAETGHGDRFAPALVPDMTPYTARRVQVDVDDLPPGYDLGTGSVDFAGSYKAGYRAEAGSAYTVTVTGVLQLAGKTPLALTSGSASEVGKKDGPVVALFTNASGAFAASGLAPGRWSLKMDAEPLPAEYLLDVPEKTAGLYRAGLLTPVRATP